MDLGAEFDNFLDFQHALMQHGSQNKTVYVIAKSKTVQQANKTVVAGQPPYKEGFKYAYVKYVCKHYGAAVPAGKGIRPLQR